MESTLKAAARPSQRATVAARPVVPKPSTQRFKEHRTVERHERLVSAWLRSLNPR